MTVLLVECDWKTICQVEQLTVAHKPHIVPVDETLMKIPGISTWSELSIQDFCIELTARSISYEWVEV